MQQAHTTRLIDLTRLISRIGRGPMTGIDRVERAYADRIIAGSEPAFGLVRAAPGHALLDRDGIAGLLARFDGHVPWGPADTLSRLHLRQPMARRRAMSDLRRLALGTTLSGRPGALATLLRRHLPGGATYLNVGHANLSQETLGALRHMPGSRIAVMLHDTIPLDHPEFAATGMPARFAAMVAQLARHADLVIWTTAAARMAGEPHLAQAGRIPPGIVAHLGVPRPAGTLRDLPERLATLIASQPYFLCVGTIEPRKNVGFLVDLWEAMARENGAGPIPTLVLAGARGWRSEALFGRLDGSPLRGHRIVEENALSDRELGGLLAGACGLLFPSHAEGFGLPPAEAAACGVPVLCNNLPAIREVLGDYPLYAAQDDPYSWRRNILALAERKDFEKTPTADVPTWEAHFSAVFAHV